MSDASEELSGGYIPLKSRASVSIRVSGVTVDREANISDSGKQLCALTQRRTAFLWREKK